MTWIWKRCGISNVIIQGIQKPWCWYEFEPLLLFDRGLVFPFWLNLKSFGSGFISERGKSVCWFIMSRQLLRCIDKGTIRSPSSFLLALSALWFVLLRPVVRTETTLAWTIFSSWLSLGRGGLVTTWRAQLSEVPSLAHSPTAEHPKTPTPALSLPSGTGCVHFKSPVFWTKMEQFF